MELKDWDKIGQQFKIAHEGGHFIPPTIWSVWTSVHSVLDSLQTQEDKTETDPSFLSSDEVEEVLSSLSPEDTTQIETIISQADFQSDMPPPPPPTPEATATPLLLYDDLLADLNELISPNQQNSAETYQQPLWPDPPASPHPLNAAAMETADEIRQPENEAINYVSMQPSTEAPISEQSVGEAFNSWPGNETFNPIPPQPGSFPTTQTRLESQAPLKPGYFPPNQTQLESQVPLRPGSYPSTQTQLQSQAPLKPGPQLSWQPGFLAHRRPVQQVIWSHPGFQLLNSPSIQNSHLFSAPGLVTTTVTNTTIATHRQQVTYIPENDTPLMRAIAQAREYGDPKAWQFPVIL